MESIRRMPHRVYVAVFSARSPGFHGIQKARSLSRNQNAEGIPKAVSRISL